MKRIAVIDGDMVAFRCAASCEGEEADWVVTARIQSFIDEILYATQADEYEVSLSGENNFRYAVYPEYKGNRKDGYRPKWEKHAKEFLKDAWSAQTIDGAEADDALGFRCNELLASNMVPICVTNDKDNKQTIGEHYDLVKKEAYYVTQEE